MQIPWHWQLPSQVNLGQPPFVRGRQRIGCSMRPVFLSVIGIFFLFLIPLVSKGNSGAALLPGRKIHLATLPYLLDLGISSGNNKCWSFIRQFFKHPGFHHVVFKPKDWPNSIINWIWNPAALFLAKFTTHLLTWNRYFGSRDHNFLQTDHLTRPKQLTAQQHSSVGELHRLIHLCLASVSFDSSSSGAWA